MTSYWKTILMRKFLQSYPPPTKSQNCVDATKCLSIPGYTVPSRGYVEKEMEQVEEDTEKKPVKLRLRLPGISEEERERMQVLRYIKHARYEIEGLKRRLRKENDDDD